MQPQAFTQVMHELLGKETGACRLFASGFLYEKREAFADTTATSQSCSLFKRPLDGGFELNHMVEVGL